MWTIGDIYPKRQVSQTPYLYSKVSLIWASKYPTLHMNAHKKVKVNGTQKWLQMVWNNTYPDNLCIPPIPASFSSHHFSK